MPDFKISLLKLFDEAIMPAFLVVGVKAVSFLLLALFFGMSLPTSVEVSSLTLLSKIFLNEKETFLLVSSVSTMFTFLVILIYFGLIIIRAHHFHETHISPRFQQKLVKAGLDHLIADSYEIYHQGLVWLTLTWLFFFHTLIAAFLGLTAWWVPFLGTAVVFSLTMMMVEDVINEVKIRKNS